MKGHSHSSATWQAVIGWCQAEWQRLAKNSQSARAALASLLRRITLWDRLNSWKTRALFYGNVGISVLLVTLVLTGVIPVFGFLAVFGVGLPATIVMALLLAKGMMLLTVGMMLLVPEGRRFVLGSLQNLIVNNKFRLLLAIGLGVTLFVLLTVGFGVFGAHFSLALLVFTGFSFSIRSIVVSYVIEKVGLDWIATRSILRRIGLGKTLKQKAAAYYQQHPRAQRSWGDTFADQFGWSNFRMLRTMQHTSGEGTDDLPCQDDAVSVPAAATGWFIITALEVLTGRETGTALCDPPQQSDSPQQPESSVSPSPFE